MSAFVTQPNDLMSPKRNYIARDIIKTTKKYKKIII
jgi:hypothetical protein